jgi:predicted Rossmann-fold nucleotide-binding protein
MTKSSDSRPINPSVNDSLLSRESWKIFQVMAEFVEGYERLIHIKPSVSIFGSARMTPGIRYYTVAEEIGELLSNAGYSVVTGGGPGIMEAANKGAYIRKIIKRGLKY